MKGRGLLGIQADFIRKGVEPIHMVSDYKKQAMMVYIYPSFFSSLVSFRRSVEMSYMILSS